VSGADTAAVTVASAADPWITPEDAAVLSEFRSGRLAAFPHRDHVRVAWLTLRERTFEEALPAFCRDLRAYAAAKGAQGLYHATITWAFFALIAERFVRDETFAQFAGRNGDLFAKEPSPLDRYYTARRLASDAARERFVLPDRLAPSERPDAARPPS
jgi:hypothetical protein